MRIPRRHILALAGGTWLSRVFAAPAGVDRFEVDRLLTGNSAERGNDDGRIEFRKYVASATVTLFSIPLVSKDSVGSGYAVVEEAGQTLSIQFGAGSYPENARGLNRLGFIQEAVIEGRRDSPVECAWLAFMTTSQEKSLDQAQKTLETSGEMLPYSASQGCGRKGRFVSRVDRLEFSSRYTWRDIALLVEKAREAMTGGVDEEALVFSPTGSPSGPEMPATFLYTVRRSMLDARTRTRDWLVFNKKQFQLDVQKERDATATAYFSAKNLLPSSDSVIRMNAMLTEKRTGEKTPFRLWYLAEAPSSLPLRFEYQAKSFLRLTFEMDPRAVTPPIQFALKTSH